MNKDYKSYLNLMSGFDIWYSYLGVARYITLIRTINNSQWLKANRGSPVVCPVVSQVVIPGFKLMSFSKFRSKIIIVVYHALRWSNLERQPEQTRQAILSRS